MESRRMVLKNLFTGQQWRNRHKEKTYGHGVRGGEGEMNAKSNMETYITICKIDSQREFAALRKLKELDTTERLNIKHAKTDSRIFIMFTHRHIN